MVQVPSVTELLGDRNRWLPAWRDRSLPHLEVDALREVTSDAGRA